MSKPTYAELEARIEALEDVQRIAFDAVDKAAEMGYFQTSIHAQTDVISLLRQADERVRGLIEFDATAFFLVGEDDHESPEFKLTWGGPEQSLSQLQNEVAFAIDIGTFARAQREKKPLIVASRHYDRQILFHVIATQTHIRGMFVGFLGTHESKTHVIHLKLLSIIMLYCANAIENLFLFNMYHRVNSNLESQILQRTEDYRRQMAVERALADISTTILKTNPILLTPVIEAQLAFLLKSIEMDTARLIWLDPDQRTVVTIDTGEEHPLPSGYGLLTSDYEKMRHHLHGKNRVIVPERPNLEPDPFADLISPLTTAFIGCALFSQEQPKGWIALGMLDGKPLPRWSDGISHILCSAGSMMTAALDRKASAEKILQQLKEKDLLMREIFHRVKNNMQVISSLINLQADRNADRSAGQTLIEMRNRIHAMASIHDMLYDADDLSVMDLTKYIEEMVPQLYRSLTISPERVRLSTDVCNVKLSIEKAIPLALIINELISNALCHAFPDDRRGTIHVRMTCKTPSVSCLEVRDDGVGLPSSLDCQNIQTLGFQLVSSLVKQLGGMFHTSVQDGTLIQIEFPLA